MTLFDFNRCSEIKEAGWSESTLRPPLKIKEIMLDFKIQWLTYCSRKISGLKKLGFIVLRIFQRFAYNIGWILSIRELKRNKV